MFLTIFTPTYNRAHTLGRLYESLTRQTDFDFEWIVVDDGSTDKTEALVADFSHRDNKFSITYCKQPNGGKHRAINRGVKLAKGDWFFIVDSDDYLTDDAVETIKPYMNEVFRMPDFAGVVFNRIYHNRETIGTSCDYEILDSDFLSYRVRLKYWGDKADIIKTSILQNYPFPDYPNEKFCTEGLVWYRMAKKYKARFINKGIYLCEYLPNGLTDTYNKIMEDSPKYSMIYYKELCLNPKLSIIQRFFAEAAYWKHYVKCELIEIAPTRGMLLRKPLIELGTKLNKLRKKIL